MPKMKTHKGIAKRIKLTASGKLLHRKAMRNHMFSKKQASTKRTYVNEYQISAGDHANVKQMLGSYK